MSSPESPSTSSSDDARSWLAELIHRRVPHVAAIYVGGTWTCIEIVQWAVDRFVLSPHLVEVALFGLLLMLPSVLLLAYEYGAPGPDPWSRLGLIGSGANLLVTTALLTLLYGGEDLGSAQQTVTVAGLSGETAQRTVPKNEFRKRVGLFYFNAEPDSLAALQRVVPYALESDLAQDLFVTTYTPAHLALRLRESGIEDLTDVPLALRRDIAQEYELPFLVSGTVERTDGPHRLTTVLRSTSDLEVVAERTFEGASLLSLIDQASVQLREDLDVPSAHIEATTDLPVSEITTTSLPALKEYAMGYDAISVQTDFTTGLRRIEAAVEKDPTFALAHMIRMYGYAMTGQFSKVASARQAAQQHKYRLVEPLRYSLRTSSLIASQEVEAAQEAVEQWATLYPNDVMAWTNLAQIQQLRGEPVEAARSLRQVVDLDPGQVKLRLQIAALLTRAGEYDEAIEDLTAYTKAFPSRAEGYTRLGEAHAAEGNPERALDAHRKALQQGPNDPTVLRRLGNAYQRMGEFEEAETHLRQALRQAESPEQVETAYLELTQYFRERGQTGAFRTYVDSLFETADSYMPQHVTLMRKASMAPHLYRYGDRDRALRIVEEAKAVIDRGGDRSVDPAALHLAIARTYTETGDLEKAASHIEEADRLFEAYGFTGLSQRFSIHHARGRLLQAQGNLQEAIAAYARDIDGDPADTGSRYRIAVIYHEIGRTNEAERYFERVLGRSPAHPRANAAYAALLHDTGRHGEARIHLDRALAAWEKADPDYQPARTARSLRDSLRLAG